MSDPSVGVAGDTTGAASGAAWFAAGLFLFGLVVGLTTALSEAPGISKELLTSLFGFVGGGLLTFGGFSLKGKDGSVTIHTRRVGEGLAAFSAGVLIAILVGPPVREGALGAPIALHASDRESCQTIVSRLGSEYYQGEQGKAVAKQDAAKLEELCRR